MHAKYITVRTDDGQEMLFTFPAAISHLWMLEAVENIKDGHGVDWRRPYRSVECVGAGFVDAEGHCFGRSRLLDIPARQQRDTALLQNGQLQLQLDHDG